MNIRSPAVLTIVCCALAVLVVVSGCTSLLPSGFGSGTGKSSASSGTGAGNAVPAAYATSPQSASSEGSGGTCGSGKTLCNGHCSDIQVDIGDCGGCGLACPTNAYCEKGGCYCKDGYTATSDGKCIPAPTTTTTGQNSGVTDPCSAGGSGLIPCPDGYCYCGTCGKQCLQGQTCTNGQCVGAVQTQSNNNGCPTGMTPCNDGLCHWLLTEPDNCGTCGNPCQTGQTCANGQCGSGIQPVQGGNNGCSVTFGTYNPEVNAEIYLDNSDTGHTTPYTMTVQPGTHSYTFKKAGYNDLSNTFTVTAPAAGAICSLMEASPMTQTCSGTICSGTCTNTQEDSRNCGGCGIPCSSGSSCKRGQCSCPSGLTKCGSTCADFQNDPYNCGSCGNPCPSGSCSRGQCSCLSGLTKCSGNCVNLRTDSNNCGNCNTMCGTGSTCQNGVCQCPSGQTLCNGACVNTQTDLNNCGYCGHKCNLGTLCSQGSCVTPGRGFSSK